MTISDKISMKWNRRKATYLLVILKKKVKTRYTTRIFTLDGQIRFKGNSQLKRTTIFNSVTVWEMYGDRKKSILKTIIKLHPTLHVALMVSK